MRNKYNHRISQFWSENLTGTIGKMLGQDFRMQISQELGFTTVSHAFHLVDLNFLNYKRRELEEITTVPSSLKKNIIVVFCVLFPGKENQGSKKTIQ